METTFYRPARSYPPVLPVNDVIIDAPPVLQPTQKGAVAWLQLVLPAVGGLGSLLFVLAYRENLVLIIGGITMAVCSVGGGITMGVVQRHSQKKLRQREQKLYLDYLAHSRVRLKSLAEKQREVGKRLYPDYKALAALLERHTYLWERRPTDGDFLTVRIGLGPVPLSCRVSLDLSTDRTVQYLPELRSQAEALVAKWNYLKDMPALISLRSTGVLAIHGRRSDTRALARALLCQVVAFQSPEDVRCMAYFPAESTSEWSWLKWLPHVRRLRQVKVDGEHTPDHLCMIAHTLEDVNHLLLDQIKPELDRRRRLSENQQNAQRDTTLPHLFVLLDNFSPFDELGQLPELNALLRDAASLGVTVICLVDSRRQEPAQIQARLSVSALGLVEYEEIKLGGLRSEGVTPDAVDPRLCERIARCIAPLSLAEAGAQPDLSQDVQLLKLMNISSADTLDVSTTWLPRERNALLKVPIGVRGDGEPLMIDVKEAAEKGMGPHGLIIGATGSGKSELLRTIIVSLAATHDPQTVNFVLIDFKGGASFADFGALPHVAGIITNLQDDTSLVDRVYYALLGEQQRRQRMLHDAGNLDNIKQYQTKWQMNPEMEPMPHLLIIADEFAELMTHRPEFLELFITLGRVGRSLGLHLLFATQRLEEGRIRGLEGHLRYRICLRTFSAAESVSVLGTPDAYYLPSAPGVGYFKVDTDTYHLFKTALVSIPFVSAQEQVSVRSRIREFTPDGKLVKLQTSIPSSVSTAKLETEEPGDLLTEMDVIIERLSRTSIPLSRHVVHQVSLPPLPKQLPLSTILQQSQNQNLDGRQWPKQSPFGTLCVPLGLLDMPLQQAQEPLILDFSGSGGHLALVGAPQAGKSTFLRTLVTSLMLTHSPRDVQIYGIDMGGGLLRIFEQAPHVGAVCGKSDRDKLRRMVRQMRKVIEDREYLFREQGIDSMATFRTRRQAGELADFPFGDVFLIIDNFALFAQEFDQLEAEIAELVASGLTYGVHVVIAANRWVEIRTKLRDNIGARLELRLNDPVDSEFGKAVASLVPIGVPGRGVNKDKLQFQIALPLADFYPDEEFPPVQQALSTFIQRTRQHWNGPAAPPVRLLPTLVRWEDLPSPATAENLPAGIPLGLEELRLDPIFIDVISAGPHFLILGDSESGKTTLLRAWMRGIEQRYQKEEASFAIIDYRKTLVDFAESQHLLTYAYNTPTLAACIGNLKASLEKRVADGGDTPLSRLQASKRWTGRHFFLFVDDYDSLATGTSTPLSPLVDYLSAGRDIGFHVVLARRVGGVGRSSFEPMLQRLREMGTSAIIMSGDSQEGRLIHNQAATLQPPGRGYLVQRNHPPTLVQIAFAKPTYTEEKE
ncbi:type VII secretion protein EccCb [Ktedonobacter sp. SOSP1-85]|uniref:type VII secretion protein EccCb n=1 Tax=Ktedonobacter sp. SOSP1-85 TaxID=2778367 RepID=UPI00191597C9|nr:type VII secretion protein EccCb [Ktedonobacter sp. SOSP1-85]